MNDWVKKAVSAFCAACGTWLVAFGVVEPETWAQVVSPEFIAAVAGVVGIVLYGVVNKVSDWVWHMATHSTTETTKVTSDKTTGEVTSVDVKSV